MTQRRDDDLIAFLQLCNPFSSSIPTVTSDEGWQYISELSKLHGVTPFLYYRTRSLGISLPEQLSKEWLGHYLHQIAEEKQARRQIKEVKEMLDSEKIPMILLKGASAMLRLYPQPGLRTFCDLDILIPADMIPCFKKVMTMAGYKPLAARNSPEDEELQKFDSHLDPLCKDRSLMIEPHLSIFGVGGDHLGARSEIWQGREETSTDGIKVDHLSKEQFIVHTLLHSSRHLSDEGFTEIKWLVDLLYAIRAWKIDWLKVGDIGHKWGVENDILPVIATLNHYWQAEVPLAEEAAPLDINTLVLGVEDRQEQYYAKLPASYFERLLKLRKLPDKTSRVRYIFHLFFPTRENLRWRYNLSSKRIILPYYILHLFYTCKKFLTGLCYQLLYHPR